MSSSYLWLFAPVGFLSILHHNISIATAQSYIGTSKKPSLAAWSASPISSLTTIPNGLNQQFRHSPQANCSPRHPLRCRKPLPTQTGILYSDHGHLSRNHLGIIISLFYNDHQPPHFHARYGGQKAIVAIDTYVMLKGNLSPRVLGLVVEWASMHQNELSENWNLAREHQPLKKIEPLE